MKKRRVLALLLAFSLTVGMNGITAFATGTDAAQVTQMSVEGQESEQGEDPGDDDPEAPVDQQGQQSAGGQQSVEEEAPADDGGDGDETSQMQEDKLETQSDGLQTFTDETGTVITYNTYVTAGYQYTVENGVLTSVTDSEGQALSGEVVLSQPAEETYTSIAAGAFAGNTAVTYVKLPSGVTSVGTGAFKGCTKLKGVYLPATVTSVGASAFEGCTAMTQLAIPKSTTTIGNRAFAGDTKLFMVYMKNADYSKLTTIGDSAFEGCTSLEKFCSDTAFDLPDSIVTIGDKAFYGCSKISQVTLSNSVTSIGTYVFANCSALRKVTLSGGLSEIPEYAFATCGRLQLVTFGSSSLSATIQIKGNAFKKCTSLGSIELPTQVNRVCTNAFTGCSVLQRVSIKNDRAVLEDGAFPNTNDDLCLVGATGSTAAAYAADANIRFAASDASKSTEYYTYTYSLTGTGTDTKKPITIKVTSKAGATENDINTISTKVSGKTVKGVKAGTDLYIYIQYGTNNAALVQGTLKCNGEEITKNADGIWHTTMPVGGAVITAEFEDTNASVTINGNEDNVSAELSNGSDLKVGQTTRLFLTSDHPDDESQISASKITYKVKSSSATDVVSVAEDGTIKALKKGTAIVTATVKDSANQDIVKAVTISVSEADVERIMLKATDYDTSVISISQKEDGSTQNVSMNSSSATKAYTFTLKATAYDSAEDDMALAMKWKSSNTAVAKLSSASTTAASSSNTVTIPSGTSGEATITVTATKQDNTTVTQQLTVSVKDYTPKLSASSITVNPNQSDGTALDIIISYPEDNRTIGEDTVELINAKEEKNLQEFTLQKTSSTSSVLSYRVTANASLSNGTYNQKVKIQVGNTVYKLPLKITVKSSSPNPKVAFAKNQAKLNLFLESDSTEFVLNVTNLGQDKVATYELQALSTSADDQKFLSNFKITKTDAGSCTIQRTDTALAYTSKNKPAVTGYLALTFEGYQSTFVKQYKITIPTQSSKPSYTLSKTSGTYYTGSDAQTVDVQLVDKKTKAVIDLGTAANNYNGYTVSVSYKANRTVTQAEITTGDDGKAVIRMHLSANPTAGKVYLVLGNTSWSSGQTFTYTYTIKTSKATPKISLTTSTVTLNSRYPEDVMTFGLKSNQTGTVISNTQTFTANTNSKTKASKLSEYAKLSVTYENGVGKVSINSNSGTVAKGTYTFVCNPVNYEYNGQSISAGKVTLKVKVTNSTSKNAPKVSAKGTLSVNASASVTTDGTTKYADNGELALTVKNLPDGYTFDGQKTVNTIECTSSSGTGYEKRFNWSVASEENTYKLVASLTQDCPAGTYNFVVTPKFSDANGTNTLTAKDMKFKVKVYSGAVSVSLSTSGKINLIDRTGDASADNSIVCTPKFTNLQGQVESAAVYDAGSSVPVHGTSAESSLFTVTVKDGLLYVRAKDGAELENNKTYSVAVWMKIKDYAFTDNDGGTWANLSFKTAQSLPKIAATPDTVDLYLSNKDYGATFVIDKQTVNAEKPAGTLASVSLDEKDTIGLASLVNDNGVISSETQADGSLKVTLKLKATATYTAGTTYQVKLYAKFAGQASGTQGTAITVNVKVNN